MPGLLVVVVGGVESMSRIPMGSDGGAWAMDPATSMRRGFTPQGVSIDLLATIEGITREDVDAYAARSHERAAAAWATSTRPGCSGKATANAAAVLFLTGVLSVTAFLFMVAPETF